MSALPPTSSHLPTDPSPRSTITPLKPVRRLGLLAHGFASWGGGLDFLRSIATALHHADPTVELHVLMPQRGPLVVARNLRDTARRLLGRATTAGHQPHPDHLKRALAGTGARLHQLDIGPRAVARATARLRLDALVPAISPQRPGGAPWVGYIFDFQHKHLPHFFTDAERAKRDREFGTMLNSAAAVIVNARDVLKDIEQFYPQRRAKVFALPFSPAPASDSFSVDVQDAIARHQVPGPYFIVCNQFWKHKDHGTAFRAFATLAARHTDLRLVCTGATSDYRFPRYFDELMQTATAAGVADRILALGLIPKADQLALLRGAVALVQPTLFEGGPGGGAVFDAIAVGQRCIVSDIPVNTEIAEPGVTFFEAGNADALADRMAAVLAEAPPAPLTPAELMARGIERRRACGQVLLQAVARVRGN